MKRAIRISILAILAFAIIVVARLPASWVKRFVPPGIACGELAGTVWNGSCSNLAYNGAPLGQLDWQLHPLSLLRGRVSAFIDLTKGDDQFVRGDFERRGDDIYIAHDLQAQLPLDPPLLPQLDSGYSGAISVNLESLEVRKKIISAIVGQVQGTSLYSKRDRMALGGYSVTFPKAAAGAAPVGEVSTLDGPFDFEGKLTLTRAPGWEVHGKARLKPDTPQSVVEALNYAQREPDGSRLIDLEGTF